MEDNVANSALIVPFIRVPEFQKVIVRDCIDEEILEECLYCKGSIMGFLRFLCCYEFSLMHGHCASRDIRIWAWVTGDDEMVATACRVEIVLHHEAKMSFPPL